MQISPGHQNRPEQSIEYVFDNREQLAETRYRELSALYDDQTIRHLEQRGIKEGWSCLEVGGGGGSIATWLCRRVGTSGRVLATDIEPRFLQRLSFANLEVRRDDIRYEGLPKGEFDLVHARLVLMHLPGRELALQRMIDSLKPGGWIVLEEFDGLSVSPNSDITSGEEEVKILRSVSQVLIARGVDMGYGRSLPQRLRANELIHVGADANMSLWSGYSAGASLFRLNYEELADAILRAGLMTEAEFVSGLQRLNEGGLIMPSPMMWSAWGQVPDSSRAASEVIVFDHRKAPVDGRR